MPAIARRPTDSPQVAPGIMHLSRAVEWVVSIEPHEQRWRITACKDIYNRHSKHHAFNHAVPLSYYINIKHI